MRVEFRSYAKSLASNFSFMKTLNPEEIHLVTYLPRDDYFEQATLASVIRFDMGMVAKGSKRLSSIRILAAYGTSEEAEKHVADFERARISKLEKSGKR